MRVFKLALLIPIMAACTYTRLDWITPRKAPRRTNAEKIGLYFTKKAIKKPYRVISRYQITTTSSSFEQGLDKVQIRAAADGCDAILLEKGWRTKTTMVSWVFLFIPFGNKMAQLDFIGIRFKEGGQ